MLRVVHNGERKNVFEVPNVTDVRTESDLEVSGRVFRAVTNFLCSVLSRSEVDVSSKIRSLATHLKV